MRANVGVDPNLLADQHLIAEYRELPMLIGSLRFWKWEIKSAIPETFNLGSGHMNFLKIRMRYAQRRHEVVKAECLRRGFRCSSLTFSLDGIPPQFCYDWNPTLEDSMKLRARIQWKLENKKPYFWHYKGHSLGPEQLQYHIKLINESELYYV